MEFEYYLEEFHFHIALACPYFTAELKYVEHLIWEFLGKLWQSLSTYVGSRIGEGEWRRGQLESPTMMIIYYDDRFDSCQ